MECKDAVVFTIFGSGVDCLGPACEKHTECTSYKNDHDCGDHWVSLGVIQRRQIHKCAICGRTTEFV